MKDNQHSENFVAKSKNKIIKFPKSEYTKEESIKDNIGTNGETYVDNDIDSDDDMDLDDEDDMSPAEERFYQGLRDSLEDEIAYYTQKGKELEGQHQFSDCYETRLENDLTRLFGKENAENILARRKAAYENMSTEVAEELAPATESISAEHTAAKVTEPTPIKMPTKKMRFFASRSAWKKIAAACVCIIIAAGVVAPRANAWRVPILQFFSERKAGYTIHEAEPGTDDVYDESDYPTSIDHVYVLGEVLEGYEVAETMETPLYSWQAFQNALGERYEFYQQLRDASVWSDNEGIDTVEANTLFGKGYYFKKGGSYYHEWSFEGYVFRIVGNLSEDLMVELANTLTLEK